MSTDRSTAELLRAQRAKDVVHDDDVRAWADYAKQGRRDVNTVAAAITADTTFAVTDGAHIVATVGAGTMELGFSGGDSGEYQEWTMELTNGNNGGATLTWNAQVLWAGGSAPTLTIAGVDILRFWSSDGGTTVFGDAVGIAMA